MGDFLLAAEHPSLPGAYVTLPIQAPTLGDAQDLAFCLISTYQLLGLVMRHPAQPWDYLFTYNHGQGLCLAAIEARSLAEASAILDAFAEDGVVVEAQHGR
ncbi:MAG: hypothetical protein RJA24_1841 [Pseudomonadota bacterium]|jgi:hypothetical protein